MSPLDNETDRAGMRRAAQRDFEEWQRSTDAQFWRVFPWVVLFGALAFFGLLWVLFAELLRRAP